MTICQYIKSRICLGLKLLFTCLGNTTFIIINEYFIKYNQYEYLKSDISTLIFIISSIIGFMILYPYYKSQSDIVNLSLDIVTTIIFRSILVITSCKIINEITSLKIIIIITIFIDIFFFLIYYFFRNEILNANYDLIETYIKNNTHDYDIKLDTYSSECSICISDFLDGDKIVVLTCNHAYHGSCIEGWFRIKRVCPLCKIDINIRNIDDYV